MTASFIEERRREEDALQIQPLQDSAAPRLFSGHPIFTAEWLLFTASQCFLGHRLLRESRDSQSTISR